MYQEGAGNSPSDYTHSNQKGRKHIMAGKPQDMVVSAIQQAKELEYESTLLRQDIDANRKFLRLFAQTGNLSDTQSKWLSDFYPLKGKGTSRTDDQVEATKQVKKAAREEIAKQRGEEVPADATE